MDVNGIISDVLDFVEQERIYIDDLNIDAANRIKKWIKLVKPSPPPPTHIEWESGCSCCLHNRSGFCVVYKMALTPRIISKSKVCTEYNDDIPF